MPKASKTGVRGLYYDAAEKRFRIDFRWRDTRTGEINRFREKMPEGTKKPAAQYRAKEVINLALEGKLLERQADRPSNLKAAFDKYLDFVKTHLGERAHKDRDRHAKGWVKVLANPPLVDLNPLALERYKATRKKEGKERADLEAALTPDFKRVVLATVLSGTRRGEILALRKEHVDLKQKVLTLTKTKSNKIRHVPINEGLELVIRWSRVRAPVGPPGKRRKF